MNLQESYEKNKKKHLLSEVSVAGSAGTFVGGAGNIIDQLFSGPYHPEFGDLKKLLDKQIEDNITIRMWTDDVTPFAEQDFFEIDWKYEYDEYVEKNNSKFKTTSDKMQSVDLDIEYDKVEDKTEENKKFVNDTNGWKSIYDNKK
tara:strand:- start:629 stop:1063 length:435 start_codon:yes stop_codon:yes gene_type:complete